MPNPSTQASEGASVPDLYRVISSETMEGLMVLVSSYLANGWNPCGGPFGSMATDPSKGEVSVICQAIYMDPDRKHMLEVARNLAGTGIAALQGITAEQQEGEEWRKPHTLCVGCKEKSPTDKWVKDHGFIICPLCGHTHPD